MSKIEEARIILQEIDGYLKRRKQEIKDLAANPSVVAWQKVKFKIQGEDIARLGIPVKEVAVSARACVDMTKKVVPLLTALANELGNQQADLIGTPEENSTLARAKKLETQIQLLDKQVNALMDHAQKLIDAMAQYKAALNFNTLIPLAKVLVKHKATLFEQGLNLYQKLTANENSSTDKVFSEFTEQVEKLITRFQKIDILQMPGLAEEIVFHTIELGQDVARSTLAIIVDMEDQLTPEIANRNLINQQLQSLQDIETINDSLPAVKKIAQRQGELIISFYHKNDTVAKMEVVTSTIELLNAFQLSIKNSLVVRISEEASKDGSPINPITIAEKNTKSFFFGLTGIVRSVKLMMSSLKGQEVVNETELQLLLEKAISTCVFFYGSTAAEIQKLKAFIDRFLEQYDRPFPYEHLFKLLKSTLAEYGSEVEKFIHSSKIDEIYRESATAIPTTFGKLTETLKSRRAYFAKEARAKLEP